MGVEFLVNNQVLLGEYLQTFGITAAKVQCLFTLVDLSGLAVHCGLVQGPVVAGTMVVVPRGLGCMSY